MDDRNVLENLVRIGIVSVVDSSARKARVIFDDIGLVSGWLSVLQRPQTGVYVSPDNEHTHTITDTYTGGGSASTVAAHDHAGTYTGYWMPTVGSKVVCLYLPVFNGDGFILGGL
jgi:phage baseplate assembly protein gpV